MNIIVVIIGTISWQILFLFYLLFSYNDVRIPIVYINLYFIFGKKNKHDLVVRIMIQASIFCLLFAS